MSKALLAILVLCAACKPPTVFTAFHATGDRPEFTIEGGRARHLDITTCEDSTRVLWQADAPTNGVLPDLVVDSTKILDEGCYYVRIIPGNRRRFVVMPSRSLLQDL
jgi:hypothetical protein